MRFRRSSSEDVLEPCRPYHPGDHARWLRGRLTRSMLISSVVGGIASATAALVVGAALTGLSGPAAAIAGWSSIILFPLAFVAIHWATIGRRRWTSIELVVWAGRVSAARYRAATGIRDPADGARAAAWMAEHPPLDGEEPETTYWRAYGLLLTGDEAAARGELARLPVGGDWERDRAELAAQIDLAEGRATDIGPLEAAVGAMPPSEARAIAAVELGALKSQVAWTCGEDDVGPVLEALSDVDGRAGGTLLRRYWLPLAAMTLAVWAAIWLLLSRLG
jgi:hypothetical protein